MSYMKGKDLLLYFLVSVICVGIGFVAKCNDALLGCLILVMLMDVLTGISLAVQRKELSSNIMFKGGCKKMGMFLIIGIWVLLGIALNAESLKTIIMGYFIGIEMMSVISNWNKCGLPIPKTVKSAVDKNENNE